MTSQQINVSINPEQINVVVDDIQINLTANSTTTAQFVNAGEKFYLDGNNGDTYFIYNVTTERLELWVEGVKQKEWGSYSGGDPFG